MKLLSTHLLACALLSCALVVGTGCNEQPLGPEESAADLAPAPDTEDISGSSNTGEVRLEAELTATNVDPLASGKATFERRPDRRRFSTEVEDVSRDGTGRVTVSRDGQILLSRQIQINNGFGDLNLDTRDGQQVPRLRAGDRVRVFNSNNQLILRGILQPE